MKIQLAAKVFGIILLSLIIINSTIAANTIDKLNVNRQSTDGLNYTEIINNYFKAQSKTLIKNSTLDDIENLLSFYDSNYSYEHVKFGIKVEGIENIRSGMVSHISDYQGDNSNSGIEKKNQILGYNCATVEFIEKFWVNDKNNQLVKIERTKIFFISFNEDKIKKIKDLSI